MKKLLLFILTITFLSCEKTPEQKAQTIIEEWMETNMPNATYTSSYYTASVQYTKEERNTLEELYMELDGAHTYRAVSFTSEGEDLVKNRLGDQVSKKISSSLNELNKSSERIAQQRRESIREEIAELQKYCEMTIKGEKGYKVDLKYQDKDKSGNISFYVDPQIVNITDVEKTEK